MCYSTGKVKTPGPLYSGFVINDCGKKKLPNCYYDSATADCSDTAAAMPLTSLQMATRSSFSDWKFDSIWVIDEGRTYPYLKWQNEPSEHNIIPGVSALRNVSSGMIMRPSDDGVRFQGNSVITCNGFCKIRLFSSNGSLVSTFTSEKPSVYEPFKNGNVNKGIYIATVFRPGKQAFSRVLINR